MLRRVGSFADPAVLVDASSADDAAVYRIDPDRALVATADFFTPIVDDPYDYGRIAATNALSDVYAMGARPLFALNLVSFPRELLARDEDLLAGILLGGADAARRAGIPIIGGHSIDDPEPKYGLCVIGEVHPDRVVRNAGARVGDALVLTKPIGTGIITTAIKRGSAPPDAVVAAVASMTRSNHRASVVMLDAGAHAATDVTGFGLIGHLLEMLRASDVSAELFAAAVPLLPAARDLATSGAVPRGTLRNLDDSAPAVEWGTLDYNSRLLLCDAQTSGGLLISVAQERVALLLDALAGDAHIAAHIGNVVPGHARVHIR